MKRLPLSVWLLVCLAACGGQSPTGPTGQKVVDVAGVWSYTSRITSATGGECLSAGLQSVIGATSTGTISISQAGATLTATTRSNSDGSACEYSGTAGVNSLSLGWKSCDAGNTFGLTCPNGARRDLLMVTNSINATVDGRSSSGTQVQTYNVVISGTSTGVGTLTASGTFTATKQ